MFKGLALIAASEAGGAVKRKIAAYGFYALAAVIGVAGIGYLLSALHIWLSVNFSPLQASLFIAGGLLIVAAIVALIGSMQGRRTETQRSPLQSAALVAAAPTAIRAVSRVSPGALIAIGVMAAGVIFGRKLGK